jgi:hypothetical protein
LSKVKAGDAKGKGQSRYKKNLNLKDTIIKTPQNPALR